MKRLLKILAMMLALLLVAVLGAVLYLRTAHGSAWLEERVSAELTRRIGYGVTLEGASFAWPPALHLSRFTMAEGEEVWLEVSDIRVEADLGAIRRGTILLPRATAGHVEMHRRPAPPIRPDRTELARVPPPLRMPSVKVDSAHLGEAVAGRAIKLQAISAALDIEERVLTLKSTADLQAEEVDLHNVRVSGRHAVGDSRWTLRAELPATVLGERKVPALDVAAEVHIENRALQVAIEAKVGESEVLLAYLAVEQEQYRLAARVNPLPDWPIDLAVAAEASGSPAEFQADITRLDLRYDRWSVALNESAELRRADEQWSLRLPGILLDDTFPLHAEGTLEGERWSLNAIGDAVPLAALPGAPAWLDPGLYANLSIEGGGTLSQPVLFMKLRPLEFVPPGDRMAPLGTVRLAAEAQYKDGELSADLNVRNDLLGFFSTRLAFPADLSLHPWRFSLETGNPVHAELHTELRLNALNQLPFGGDQLVHGTLHLHLAYDGERGEVYTPGRCELIGGAYEHLVWGTKVRNFNGAFRPDGRTLILEGASAWDRRDGTMRATVILDFTEPLRPEVAATVTLRNFQVVESDPVTATGSGDMLVKANAARTDISGSFRVETAEIHLNRLPPPRPPTLEVIETGAVEEEIEERAAPRTERAHALRLAVDVNMPSGMMVRGPNFDSLWTGRLSLGSQEGELDLLGELNLARGSMNFLGRRFLLREGKLLFRGDVASPPLLDVRAEHERRDLTARLHLSGPINRPRFELTSVPAFPSDEVLARVLFGRGRDTITPAQAAQLALAVRSLREDQFLDGWQLTGRLKDAIGIDRIELVQEGETGGEAQLVLGRYTESGAYLEVSDTLGRGGESRIRIEKDLWRRFSIETEAGTRMRPGIGVNWRYDY